MFLKSLLLLIVLTNVHKMLLEQWQFAVFIHSFCLLLRDEVNKNEMTV